MNVFAPLVLAAQIETSCSPGVSATIALFTLTSETTSPSTTTFQRPVASEFQLRTALLGPPMATNPVGALGEYSAFDISAYKLESE